MIRSNTHPPISCAIPCNLCEGTDIEQVGQIDRRGGPLRTVICRGCGLVWTDPRPTLEQMRKFYSEKYRLQYKGASQPKPKHVYRETLRALRTVSGIEAILHRGCSLLDVGAGAGFLIYALRSRGIQAQGIEPNRGYAEFARREFHVPVLNAFLQDADFGDGNFHVITLSHVLEHVEDPLGTIRRLTRWIKPGGFLMIEVPNLETSCHAPRNRFHLAHLYNFNACTLENLGRRAGLTVSRSTVVGDEQHLHTIFQLPPTGAAQLNEFSSPENFRRVREILRGHTTLRHFTSARPYARAVRKNWNYILEWAHTRGGLSGRQIADKLLRIQAPGQRELQPPLVNDTTSVQVECLANA